MIIIEPEIPIKISFSIGFNAVVLVVVVSISRLKLHSSCITADGAITVLFYDRFGKNGENEEKGLILIVAKGFAFLDCRKREGQIGRVITVHFILLTLLLAKEEKMNS